MMLKAAQPLPSYAETNYQRVSCERSGDGQFLPLCSLCFLHDHAVPPGDQHELDQYVS